MNACILHEKSVSLRGGDKVLRLLSIIILLSYPSALLAEGRYLCEEIKSAGMKYNEATEEWDRVFFTPDSRYIVSPPGPESISKFGFTATDISYVVTKIGDKHFSFHCREGFKDSGILSCISFRGSFSMNRKSLRFQETYEGDYLSPDLPEDGNAETPFISIGVCSPF